MGHNKVKMRTIKYYIEHIKDETAGACEYAEKYLQYKKDNATWAKMYSDMAKAELIHAENMVTMGAEYIEGLTWNPEEDSKAWQHCIACAREKMAMAQLMLSK